ncbi:MAG: sulfatase-like hydrolase/transferase [Planctomycetota bacterium]
MRLVRLRCVRYILVGAWLLIGIQVGGVRAIASQRPNIVQIMADDLGWGAVGYNGQKFVKTPNVDELARKGMVFRRAYAAPVCSPTRASLQVGFHAGHTWTDWNIRWPAKGFRQRSVTIGKALKRAGYVSGAFGKWGFGGSKGEGSVLRGNPLIDNPTTVPTKQGYDVFYGCLDHVRAHTFFMDSLWKSAPNSLHGLELVPTGNTPAEKFTNYCDDLYAAHAAKFLRQRAVEEAPFYLQLHFQTPHAPLGQITQLDGWFDAYDKVDTSDWSDGAKQYAAMVTRMDQHIGHIMDLLRDPNQDGDYGDSIAGETMVLFTSDNGSYRGRDFIERFELNGPLRGGKGSLYEGGIRVPLVVCWPERVNAGRVSERPVDITDLLPTFADLAGGKAPAGIDGVSFAPTLTGQGYQRPRPYLAFESRNNWAIIQGPMKLIRQGRGDNRYALYNLERDVSEEHNLLADEEASARERSRYAELKDELLEVAGREGVIHGSAIHAAEANKNGKDGGKPYYVRFPHWVGDNEASLADRDNWDFEASPADPETWVACVRNRRDTDQTANLTEPLKLVGLEIGGAGARQTVRIEKDGELVANNEIRLASGARLSLAGGTVRSPRSLELLPGGELVGHGTVSAGCYNSGKIRTEGPLVISGDHGASKQSTLALEVVAHGGTAPLTVKGTFHAAGRLVVRSKSRDELPIGATVSLIDAGAISGRFDALVLPRLPEAATWNTDDLYRSGVIRVKKR